MLKAARSHPRFGIIIITQIAQLYRSANTVVYNSAHFLQISQADRFPFSITVYFQ